jgi:putative salt-induced outer membrane protein YdiY
MCYTAAMRRFAAFFVLLTVITGTGLAHAGIVNVQSILTTEAEEGLSGSVTGSLDWRTGNTDLLLLSVAPVASYRSGDHLFVTLIKGEFGESADERIIFRSFEHLRYRYSITDRVLGEAFAQHTFDEFKRLRLRALFGAGPNFTLVTRDKLTVSLGLAYMLEYEELSDDGAIDAGETDLAHRASTYLTGAYELDDRVQLVNTVYAQPRLNDPADMRVLDESQLVVKLTEKVSLKTSFIVAYDRAPPADIERLDTALKTAITYAF